MKLKQLPEDFIVEEILHPQFTKEGKYALYLLEKTSLDTLEAKRIIIKKFKIPYPDVGVAGLKDKHAKTTQHITIKGKEDKKYEFVEKSVSLKFLGYIDAPLKSGDLEKNKFTITVRALKQGEFPKIQKNSEEVKLYGIPNYFDSQRFGSFQGTDDFVAKHLIFDDFETALKLFMTRHTGFERANIRTCRREIAKEWGNWVLLLEQCKPVARPLREEYRIIEYLAQHPADFIGAFRLSDKSIKELFVSAYQSYLWNECVKAYLRQKIQKNLHTLPYAAGKLLFYKILPINLLELWKAMTIPLLSHKTISPPQLAPIIEKVLAKEGILLKDLKIKKMTALFFKERQRKLLLFPEELEREEPESDELNQRCYKIKISFSLEKGAYATLILKRIFQL